MPIPPRIIATLDNGTNVSSVAFSADGRRIATSDSQKVQVFTVEPNALVATVTAADIPLDSVTFGSTGIVAVSGQIPGIHGKSVLLVFDPPTNPPLWRVDAASFLVCVFSPDGLNVLVRDPVAVQVYDARSGAKKGRFELPGGPPAHPPSPLRHAAFSPDGRSVAIAMSTSTTQGEVVVMDAVSGAIRKRFARAGGVTRVAYSPDGQSLGFGANTEIGIFDTATDALRVRPNPGVPHHGNLREIFGLTFSADNTMLGVVSTTWNGINPTIQVFDAATFGMKMELPDGFSSLFQFSPDSQWVFTAENDSDLHVRDAATGADQFILAHSDNGGIKAEFGPDGGLLAAVAVDKTVTVFKLATELFRLAHDGAVRSVAFDPGGVQVLTASEDKTARVFDVGTGVERAKLAHGDKVVAAVWVPGQPQVVTASADAKARVFDISNPAAPVSVGVHQSAVTAVAVSSDGRRLASADADGVVQLVALGGAGIPSHTLAHDDAVTALTFSPDGTRLATACNDGAARIFDTAAGGDALLVFAQGGAVNDVAFHPDGVRLATAGADKTARIYNTQTGAEFSLAHGAAVHAVAFDATGHQLATACADGMARVLEVGAGTPPRQLAHGGPVNAVAFSADGDRLATACDDQTARVFRIGDGKQLRTLSHDAAVLDVTISSDGTLLATASADNNARIFRLSH